MLPEGLQLQNIDALAELIPTLGLNCIRFTYSIDYTKNPKLSGLSAVNNAHINNVTVQQIHQKNPGLLSKSLDDIYLTVIKALAKFNITVIMDNHVSKASWCCDTFGDHNGWWDSDLSDIMPAIDIGNIHLPGFGLGNVRGILKETFSTAEWLAGLEHVAKQFGNEPNVIGMSLRNEPRYGLVYSSLQKNMKKGAEVVSAANPDLLIIMSGYLSATDLSKEIKNPLPAQLSPKIQARFAYEGHHYRWLAIDQFLAGTKTSACLNNKKELFNRLYQPSLGQSYPFIMSEWGTDLASGPDSLKSDPWFNCFYADLVQLDLDNSYWVLNSIYYVRNGMLDSVEPYSLTNSDMSSSSSPELSSRLAFLRASDSLNDSPDERGLSLVHTESGKCINVDSLGTLILRDCDKASGSKIWSGVNYNGSATTAHVKHLESGNCVVESSGSLILSSCENPNAVSFITSEDGLRMTVYIPSSKDKSATRCLSSDYYAKSLEILPCDPNDISQWIVLLGRGAVFDFGNPGLIICEKCANNNEDGNFNPISIDKWLDFGCWDCCIRNSKYCLKAH